MSLSAEIVERHFGQRDGELLIGGVPVTRVVERHGTPLFIYDRGVMKEKLDLLLTALPSRFELYYSIKANPNQSILKFFLAQGCGLEIASGGEIYQALAAGCDADRVLFAGPGKTPAELEYALSEGIGEIHIESLQEIDSLVEIARRLRRRANVAIRVNPAVEAQGGRCAWEVPRRPLASMKRRWIPCWIVYYKRTPSSFVAFICSRGRRFSITRFSSGSTAGGRNCHACRQAIP